MPIRDPAILKAETPQPDPMMKPEPVSPLFSAVIFAAACLIVGVTLYGVTRPPDERPLESASTSATAPSAAPSAAAAPPAASPPSAAAAAPAATPSTTGQKQQ